MRYRKRPVEVEAWQIGSDEPMPEWLPYDSLGLSGYFKRLLFGYWYILDSPFSTPRLMDDFRFKHTYEVVE